MSAREKDVRGGQRPAHAIKEKTVFAGGTIVMVSVRDVLGPVLEPDPLGRQKGKQSQRTPEGAGKSSPLLTRRREHELPLCP